MKVVRAASAGACYGVQRALDLAHEAARAGGSVQTLGPLIHNPRVVADMEAAGIMVAQTADDANADAVIIRSHGVTPAELAKIKAHGCRVVNATCPYVIRAQKAAAALARDGMLVVVVGEESHPEVEGLRAWAQDAGGEVVVVGCADELPEGLAAPVGVVVQTTQRREMLDGVVGALRVRGIEPVVRDTICSSTSERQDAARGLAAQVDAMVVIGGHNSSNTTRLFEICRDVAPKAFHIEGAEELRRDDFVGCAVVGVTAGASTPDSQIEAVERLLGGW